MKVENKIISPHFMHLLPHLLIEKSSLKKVRFFLSVSKSHFLQLTSDRLMHFLLLMSGALSLSRMKQPPLKIQI